MFGGLFQLGGPSRQQTDDLAARITALEAAQTATQQLGPFTVATLPDPAAWPDRYAIVTDLFGEKRDIVRSSKVGTFSFWQPVRPTYGKSYDAAGANMTIRGLTHASIVSLTGNISAGVTRNITIDPAGAWPGWTVEVAFDGVLGLGSSLNILGTGLGSTLAMVLGGRRRVFAELVGGALQLKQLQ